MFKSKKTLKMKKFYINFLLLVVLFLNLCNATKFSFDGYRLLRITPKTGNHLKLLNKFKRNEDVRLLKFLVINLIFKTIFKIGTIYFDCL